MLQKPILETFAGQQERTVEPMKAKTCVSTFSRLTTPTGWTVSEKLVQLDVVEVNPVRTGVRKPVVLVRTDIRIQVVRTFRSKLPGLAHTSAAGMGCSVAGPVLAVQPLQDAPASGCSSSIWSIFFGTQTHFSATIHVPLLLWIVAALP
jgi:hypothetical protein